ncbi:hypothetical protein CBY09_11285 [Acidovorax kalamii]|uniref:IS110 family transposase n=1 Tax=Acidovorax kalamii TaxID=2004485 RepID=A0A235EM82_9BURK|nr:hypothetical protein CBY09_11285 [Acidovorax kalamii]
MPLPEAYVEFVILGIDLAKRVFQLHGADRRGRALHRATVTRAGLLESVRQLHPLTITTKSLFSLCGPCRAIQLQA